MKRKRELSVKNILAEAKYGRETPSLKEQRSFVSEFFQIRLVEIRIKRITKFVCNFFHIQGRKINI